MIYADWNATTPPCEAALDAMREAAASAWANPSSLHRAGRAARAAVDRARERLASALGRDARDVVFTSGGTEANNLALRGSAPPRELLLVTSRAEHPSVVETAEALAREGATVAWLPLGPTARVDVSSLERVLAGAAAPRKLVCLQAVNHETGALQPLLEASAAARRHGAALVVDAVQALGRVPLAPLQVADALTVSSHKVRGPKGVGALVTRPGWPLEPLLRGGAQERGRRAGTLDPIALAGFGAALAELDALERAFAAVAPLRDRLEAALVALGGASNRGAPSAPHVVNVSFAGARSDELTAALDLEGVAASSGAACSAGTASPSAVVAAAAGPERARGAVRLSLGPGSTEAEIEALILSFSKVLSRARR